jgi:hypothetical protein
VQVVSDGIACMLCAQDLGEAEPAADGLLTLRITAAALGATDCFEKLDVTFDVPQLSRQRRRALSAAAAAAAAIATAGSDSTSMVSNSDDAQQRSLITLYDNATDFALVRGHCYTLMTLTLH